MAAGCVPGAAAGAAALDIGRRVSDALVEIVRRPSVRPPWIVGKGGITAYDIARYGLDVNRAMVLGQAIPGVPVWRTGAESRLPGSLYVVFPGNVGDDAAIGETVTIPRETHKQPLFGES